MDAYGVKCCCNNSTSTMVLNTIVSTSIMDKVLYNTYKVNYKNRRNDTYEVYGESVRTIPYPHTYIP